MARRRQIQGVGAAIVGVAAPLGEAAALEVVHECDHRAAVDAECLAQCLLGLALGGGKVAEHPEVPRVEVEGSEALGEAPVFVGAQLHQQKAGAPAQPPRWRRARARWTAGHPVRGYRTSRTVDIINSSNYSLYWGGSQMGSVSVRYITDDVDASVAFYVDRLGFGVEMHPGAGFAVLARGDLRLLLNRPGAGGAGQPLPDGRSPRPGGWNRIQIEVSDLEREVEALRQAGANFRNDIVTGRGGSQILLEDPSGNPIELFQPAAA